MQTLNHFGKTPSAMTSNSLPSGKPNSSSILVKQLSTSELSSLKQEMQDSLKQLQALASINQNKTVLK